MMSPKDQTVLRDIDRKWTNFITDRRRNSYQHTDQGANWLTINEREELLTKVLDILNNNQKTEKIYEIP